MPFEGGTNNPDHAMQDDVSFNMRMIMMRLCSCNANCQSLLMFNIAINQSDI